MSWKREIAITDLTFHAFGEVATGRVVRMSRKMIFVTAICSLQRFVYKCHDAQ
jgi:hypothetical protein